MLVRILQVAAVLASVAGVLWLALALSFRGEVRPVLDRIRRMNRAVTNPRQLRTAGQPGAYASVVNHDGRTSGTAYRTPVVAVPTGSGVVVALPCGAGADWVRNVLAAGRATVEHEGRTLRLSRPQLLTARDANGYFPVKEQRLHRLYGVDDFLLLQGTAEDDPRA